MKWCLTKDEKVNIKAMVIEEMKYNVVTAGLLQNEKHVETVMKKMGMNLLLKKSRLFSFMDNTDESSMRKDFNETEVYLQDENLRKTNPMPLWKANRAKYPMLSNLAKKFLSMPAPVESF